MQRYYYTGIVQKVQFCNHLNQRIRSSCNIAKKIFGGFIIFHGSMADFNKKSKIIMIASKDKGRQRMM